MKLNKRLVILALCLSFLATVAVYYYLNTGGDTNEEKVEYINVVTAVDTIPAFTKITEDMLSYESIPPQYVHEDAVLKKEDILSGITTDQILAGEQILKERVVINDDAASLSYQITENMRAITIPITEITGIAGYAKKGDRIDILVSYTDEEYTQENYLTDAQNEESSISNQKKSVVYTQLQYIEVLEEGPYGAADEDKNNISSFTVLVTPEQAEVLAFAIMNGTIQCTLRNPSDNVKTELQKYGTDNFSTWRDR